MKHKKTRFYVLFDHNGDYIICDPTLRFTSSGRILNEDGENIADWVLGGPKNGWFKNMKSAKKFADSISEKWENLLPNFPIIKGGNIEVKDNCLIFYKKTGDLSTDLFNKIRVPIKCSI